ncbi:MAG: hypothetical protein PSX71_11735 [bacterium]|nr:hypothetical protein [bacterium]
MAEKTKGLRGPFFDITAAVLDASAHQLLASGAPAGDFLNHDDSIALSGSPHDIFVFEGMPMIFPAAFTYGTDASVWIELPFRGEGAGDGIAK